MAQTPEGPVFPFPQPREGDLLPTADENEKKKQFIIVNRKGNWWKKENVDFLWFDRNLPWSRYRGDDLEELYAEQFPDRSDFPDGPTPHKTAVEQLKSYETTLLASDDDQHKTDVERPDPPLQQPARANTRNDDSDIHQTDTEGQATEQSARQSAGQSTKQPTEESTKQPTRQSTEQPTEQPTKQSTKQPIEQPTGKPTGQPTGDPGARPRRRLVEELAEILRRSEGADDAVNAALEQQESEQEVVEDVLHSPTPGPSDRRPHFRKGSFQADLRSDASPFTFRPGDWRTGTPGSGNPPSGGLPTPAKTRGPTEEPEDLEQKLARLEALVQAQGAQIVAAEKTISELKARPPGERTGSATQQPSLMTHTFRQPKSESPATLVGTPERAESASLPTNADCWLEGYYYCRKEPVYIVGMGDVNQKRLGFYTVVSERVMEFYMNHPKAHGFDQMRQFYRAEGEPKIGQYQKGNFVGISKVIVPGMKLRKKDFDACNYLVLMGRHEQEKRKLATNDKKRICVLPEGILFESIWRLSSRQIQNANLGTAPPDMPHVMAVSSSLSDLRTALGVKRFWWYFHAWLWRMYKFQVERGYLTGQASSIWRLDKTLEKTVVSLNMFNVEPQDADVSREGTEDELKWHIGRTWSDHDLEGISERDLATIKFDKVERPSFD